MDQDGKFSAKYVGTKCRNGSPKRKIWVAKSLVEKLSANHSMQGKADLPPRHFYSLEERNDPLVEKSNVPQRDYERVDRYQYHHRGNRDKIACAHVYPNHPERRNNPRNSKFLLVNLHLLLLSHLLACGWLRRNNSSTGLCLR